MNNKTQPIDKALGWSLTILAFVLSSIGAWFSVYGLAQLFPGLGTYMYVLGGTIEISKLFVVLWLHRSFSVKNYGSWLLKSYLIPAAGVIMLITSIGIFGFLSSSHVKTDSNVQVVEASMQKLQIQRDTEQKRLDTLTSNVDRSRALVDSQLERNSKSFESRNNKSPAELRRLQELDRRATSELKTLQKEQQEQQKIVEVIDAQLIDAKSKISSVESEIGPLKFVAESVFGATDRETNALAVKIMIVLLMLVFDPLAVAMLVAAQASFGYKASPGYEKEWFEKTLTTQPKPEKDIPEKKNDLWTYTVTTTTSNTDGDVELTEDSKHSEPKAEKITPTEPVKVVMTPDIRGKFEMVDDDGVLDEINETRKTFSAPMKEDTPRQKTRKNNRNGMM